MVHAAEVGARLDCQCNGLRKALDDRDTTVMLDVCLDVFGASNPFKVRVCACVSHVLA